MKKVIIVILLLTLIYIPNTFAHEKYDDGWHFVIANSEEEKGKEYKDQTKEWGYYENGKEIMRYSNLLGSHRGWGTAPENSLAAFELNKEKGYYTFETDVRFTKDNIAVLIHDNKINVVAKNNDLSDLTEDVFVKDLTYNQLKENYIFNIERINHGSPTVLSEYNTNRITTFEEMLDFVKENKMYVNIELKEGTKEQIESLVKMTQDKNMHNYVRWISFYSDLLAFVKDYDEDESIGQLKSDSCDDSHNLYCGEELDYYMEKLKTDSNMLWIAGSPEKTPSTACAVDLPTNYDNNLPDKYLKTPIPQGEVKLTETTKTIIIGQETSIKYQYEGDGEIHCESSDKNKLTCEVDSTNKTINLKSIADDPSEEEVIIYATQGINYSASNDNTIQLRIEKEGILVKVPNTLKTMPIVYMIITILSIATGVGIIGYTNIIKRNN